MTQQFTLAELLQAAAHRLAEYRLKLDNQMTERGRGIVSVVSVITVLSDIGPLMVEAVKALTSAETRPNDKDIQWRAWAVSALDASTYGLWQNGRAVETISDEELRDRIEYELPRSQEQGEVMAAKRARWGWPRV